MNFVKLSRFDLYGYLLPGMLLVAMPYFICPGCIKELFGDVNEWVLVGIYILASYIVGMFYGKILLNYLNFLPNSNPSLLAIQREWNKSKNAASRYKLAHSTIEKIEDKIVSDSIYEVYTKAWTLIEDKISESTQSIEAQQGALKGCTPISALYALAFAWKFALLGDTLYLGITIATLVAGFLMILTYRHINETFPSLVWECYLWDKIKKDIESKQPKDVKLIKITV